MTNQPGEFLSLTTIDVTVDSLLNIRDSATIFRFSQYYAATIPPSFRVIALSTLLASSKL